jgi:hypothetical protein
MSYRIRKILVEFVRSTSHLRSAFRWEVPILKLMNPTERVNIHSIPAPTESDVHTFAGDREAFLSLQSVYGEYLQRAYVDFQAFQEAFKATVARDSVGNVVTAGAGDQSPDATKLEALTTMGHVSGVTPEIAAAMFEAGLRSIEDIARSTLDQLESIPGIGPSVSPLIHNSAKKLVLGSFGETPAPAPGTELAESPEPVPAAPEPTAVNPFAIQ